MPRHLSSTEEKFAVCLRRALAKQPQSLVLYCTPSGINLHDASDGSRMEFDPNASIETLPYGGAADCGDY